MINLTLFILACPCLCLIIRMMEFRKLEHQRDLRERIKVTPWFISYMGFKLDGSRSSVVHFQSNSACETHWY